MTWTPPTSAIQFAERDPFHGVSWDEFHPGRFYWRKREFVNRWLMEIGANSDTTHGRRKFKKVTKAATKHARSNPLYPGLKRRGFPSALIYNYALARLVGGELSRWKVLTSPPPDVRRLGIAGVWEPVNPSYMSKHDGRILYVSGSVLVYTGDVSTNPWCKFGSVHQGDRKQLVTLVGLTHFPELATLYMSNHEWSRMNETGDIPF